MSGLLRSWVESANQPDTSFPLNNLPFGSVLDAHGERCCVVAIGDMVLDVSALGGHFLPGLDGTVLKAGRWNDFMELGPGAWVAFRKNLTAALREGSQDRAALEPHLSPMARHRFALPFEVAEFTDFYSGRHHAENVGTMFRGPEHALPPNWVHMPIGYNGRASSVVVSGTDVVRPRGQVKGADDTAPRFEASARFDFELELGAVVGQPSDGPLSVDQAFDHIFGFVLLNDWSARDIQAWEYKPLGPFQAKATATTLSPWIVPAAALEPFRVSSPARLAPLLDHLKDTDPMTYDIALEVGITPSGGAETPVTRTNAKELYYSAAQQLAHHTACGCPMRVGDLLGSGTISGPERDMRGSMLELTWGGAEPLALRTGETRRFLVDGDTVTLRGHAQGDGYRIGFGECAGVVRPAR